MEMTPKGESRGLKLIPSLVSLTMNQARLGIRTLGQLEEDLNLDKEQQVLRAEGQVQLLDKCLRTIPVKTTI